MDELVRTPRLVAHPVEILVLVFVVTLTACGGQSTSPTGPSTSSGDSGGATAPATPPLGGPSVVMAGAGDIAMCGPNLSNAFSTASLLDTIGAEVFTAGDNTQATGSADDLATCYTPTWGRHRSRTFPSPGNHDFETAAAAPYYDYFGANAGPFGRGYYSYDRGAWHIVSLNSNVSMKAGSAQAEWLRRDLDASDKPCTLAYWHFPLFTSGPNGSSPSVRDSWAILYDHGAEIVVNGHDHIYERFAQQDPQGRLDAAAGIRQFTVGTGGAFLTRVERLQAHSEAQGVTWGVLKLTLHATGYDWQFIAVPGGGFSDSGSGNCH
jgi:hypothetical protein